MTMQRHATAGVLMVGLSAVVFSTAGCSPG
jgi:hypothetical protein